MNKWFIGALCATSLNVAAQVDRCTSQQKLELTAAYEEFRTASRGGDLKKIKILSSKAVSADIAKFEKTAPNSSVLARQMGAVMPALSGAKEVRCDYSGHRARFIIQTETVDRDSKKSIPVTSIVMFERTPASKWLVGDKAVTNPFSPQSPESLLQHEKLRLP